MSRPLTLASIVGARPQFIKLAPIANELAKHKEVNHVVIHTGQHYDDNMSASIFQELDLPEPDQNLFIGSGTHAEQTAVMLTRLAEVFLADPPDAVLVYGDTNSTLAATLAAVKIHLPVVHIEAGLRSFNRKMPEEINRLVADHCADRLYAPTPQALSNLEHENLAGRAVLTGDVMYDSVLHNIELANEEVLVLQKLGLKPGQYGLVTVHRQANTSLRKLEALMNVLEETARRYLQLIFPVHPRTRAMLDRLGYMSTECLTLVEPLPYLENLALIQAAAVVITDSGGVQKEAAFLHTPCLTIRSDTEWTETVEMGINRLVGDAGANLVAEMGEVLNAGCLFDDNTLRRLRLQYGNGNASVHIVEDCIRWIS